jgi:MFS family permease
MAIFLAVALGGTPVGAMIIGWTADNYGPRWGMGIGSAFSFSAVLVGLFYLIKYRHLRLRIQAGRLRLTLDDANTRNEVP